MVGQPNRACPDPRAQPLFGQKVVVIGEHFRHRPRAARLAGPRGRRCRSPTTTPIGSTRSAGARRGSTAAFDATDFGRLGHFFDELPGPIDHVLVSGGGPYYAPLAEIDFDEAERDMARHIWLPLQVARKAVDRVRPGGSLLFIGPGTDEPQAARGRPVSTFAAALPTLSEALTLGSCPFA